MDGQPVSTEQAIHEVAMETAKIMFAIHHGNNRDLSHVQIANYLWGGYVDAMSTLKTAEGIAKQALGITS